MRDWINAVFVFIGASTLSDLEYAGIDQTGMTSMVYNQAAYDQMAAVLLAREAVSDMQARLVGVFTAKGAQITQIETAKTNVYIGSVL